MAEIHRPRATVLATLTGDGLKDMGIAAVGHRRELLDAIDAWVHRCNGMA